MRSVIHTSDALAVLRSLPEASVHCCVTSPPYWRMRDYQVDGQYGLEPTIEDYLARQVEVFREVRRVLRPDGTLWMNIGDRYSSGGRGGYAGDLAPRAQHYSRKAGMIGTWQSPPPGFKDKELLGLPWRLALALQADGWWLRADCIWHKPNAKPESVKDRPGSAHEHVFLLAKSERYYYDWWAVREPQSEHERTRRLREAEQGHSVEYKICRDALTNQAKPGKNGVFRSSVARQKIALTGMRGLRAVWTLATQGFKGAHFATYPVKLAERCILAGSSEHGCCSWCGTPWRREFTRTVTKCHSNPEFKAQGIHRIGNTEGNYEPPKFAGWVQGCKCSFDGVEPCTVLDPYAGAGTTLVASVRLRRRAIGIELNPEYAEMARARVDAEIASKVEVSA